MGVWKGAYSEDDKECNTGVGLDRDSYYPGKKPNKYVADDGLKGRIFLDTDNDFARSQYPSGSRAEGGFSGVVSRNRSR